MTVKGMEVASKKSDMARLKMKTFLAVLISFLRRTVDITVRLPRTKLNQTMKIDDVQICKEYGKQILYLIFS